MPSFTRRISVFALAILLLLPLAGCGTPDPYVGMTEQELYLLARGRYEAQEWKESIQALDRFLVSFGASDLAPDVRLLLAHSHFANKDYLTSRSEYQRFLDRHPSHPEAPVAALGMCRSLAALAPVPARDQAYTLDAQAICRNVVLDYAGTPESAEAAELANGMRLQLAEKEYLNADFYMRRGLYDSAIKYYEFVVQLYTETVWARRALLGIYRANQAIGYEDLAEEARERLLAEYPDSPEAQEIRTLEPIG